MNLDKQKNISIKLRCYLTPIQICQFNQDAGNCRFFYNLVLEFKKQQEKSS